MQADLMGHVMVEYSDRKCYLENHHLNEDLYALLYEVGQVSSTSSYNGALISCK